MSSETQPTKETERTDAQPSPGPRQAPPHELTAPLSVRRYDADEGHLPLYLKETIATGEDRGVAFTLSRTYPFGILLKMEGAAYTVSAEALVRSLLTAHTSAADAIEVTEDTIDREEAERILSDPNAEYIEWDYTDDDGDAEEEEELAEVGEDTDYGTSGDGHATAADLADPDAESVARPDLADIQRALHALGCDDAGPHFAWEAPTVLEVWADRYDATRREETHRLPGRDFLISTRECPAPFAGLWAVCRIDERTAAATEGAA